MAQFIGKETQYLPFGSVHMFPPPKPELCGRNQVFCQPTIQNDDIAFQFLAAETVDLISSGTFPAGSYQGACGVQDWCGQGWTLGSNKITHVTGQSEPLKQLAIFTVGDYFRVNFTISGMTTGNLIVNSVSTTITQNGDYEFYVIWTDAGNLDIRFLISSTFDGSVSDVRVVEVARTADYTVQIHDQQTGVLIDTVPAVNVTASQNIITVDFNWALDVTVTNGCREIRIFLAGAISVFEDDFSTDQGWTTAANVTIAGGVMSYLVAVPSINSTTINVLQTGVEYEITYDVLNFVGGQVTVAAGTNGGTARTGNGTFTETLICNDITLLRFTFINTGGVGDLDIDNIIITKANTNFDGQSECYDLQDAHDCSLLWVWSNNERWGSYGAGFEHKLRLTCNFRGTAYPNERSIGEDSGGTKSVDYFSLRKQRLLDIDFAPDYIHDAIAAFFGHDNRVINGKSYIFDDEYNPSSPNDSITLYKDLMNATIEIEETAQPDQINRNE